MVHIHNYNNTSSHLAQFHYHCCLLPTIRYQLKTLLENIIQKNSTKMHAFLRHGHSLVTTKQAIYLIVFTAFHNEPYYCFSLELFVKFWLIQNRHHISYQLPCRMLLTLIYVFCKDWNNMLYKTKSVSHLSQLTFLSHCKLSICIVLHTLIMTRKGLYDII